MKTGPAQLQLRPQCGAPARPGTAGLTHGGQGLRVCGRGGSVGKGEALASSPQRASSLALGLSPVTLERRTSGLLPHRPPAALCPRGGGLCPLGVVTVIS